MIMIYPTARLSEVFQDTGGHIENAEIIIAHSTNKEDIREFALKKINLKSAVQVVDLGCGFGFFTKALKSKISPNAHVTGIDCFSGYSIPFLKNCRESGFRGKFYDTGTVALDIFKRVSVDMVISSFSIYFFPDVVSHVASILRKSGVFIIITHYSTHLCELTEMIIEILRELGYPQVEDLPHNKLINNFPAENGEQIFSNYFNEIVIRDYENALVFTHESIDALMKYVNYKKSFFIPENLLPDDNLYKKIELGIREKVCYNKEFRITKKDAVFICSDPLNY